MGFFSNAIDIVKAPATVFDKVKSSLANAAGSVVGNAVGSAVGAFTSQLSADAQMKFQENVLKNQHQWEVKDLLKAGLNPMLSAGGSGPGGASGASWEMPDLDLSGALTAGADIERMEMQKEQMRQNSRLMMAQKRVADQNWENMRQSLQTEQWRTLTEKALAGIKYWDQNSAYENYRQQRYITETMGAQKAYELERAKNELEVERSPAGKRARHLQRWISPSSAGSLLQNLKYWGK